MTALEEKIHLQELALEDLSVALNEERRYIADQSSALRELAAAVRTACDARRFPELTNALAEADRVLSLLGREPPEKDPDYCYDPDEWEVTYPWGQRGELLAEFGMDPSYEPRRVATLSKGPDKWVVSVPVTWDDDGNPDEREDRWLDSEMEAQIALSREVKR